MYERSPDCAQLKSREEDAAQAGEGAPWSKSNAAHARTHGKEKKRSDCAQGEESRVGTLRVDCYIVEDYS